MKYVKILFAIALVFTMCSGFFSEKDHSKPVCFLEFLLHLRIRVVIYLRIFQILDSAKR